MYDDPEGVRSWMAREGLPDDVKRWIEEVASKAPASGEQAEDEQ
jgi:hypothetical protein